MAVPKRKTSKSRRDKRRAQHKIEAPRLSVCPVCGQACKRRTLPAEGPIVYVGDGYSDRCAALAADRVFATRGLAQYLDELGVAYEPFDDLHDVTRGLEAVTS